MTKMLKDGDVELKFAPTKVDVAKSGDIGYVQGTYTDGRPTSRPNAG